MDTVTEQLWKIPTEKASIKEKLTTLVKVQHSKHQKLSLRKHTDMTYFLTG